MHQVVGFVTLKIIQIFLQFICKSIHLSLNFIQWDELIYQYFMQLDKILLII